jgi:all-trans-retinol dehydrogenase (NAD+)
VSGALLLDTPDYRIVKTFEVNVLAHFWTIKVRGEIVEATLTLQAFLPDMLENKQGHVVNVASLAGHAGTNKLVDYCASKFAAVGLDEAFRVEIAMQVSYHPEAWS